MGKTITKPLVNYSITTDPSPISPYSPIYTSPIKFESLSLKNGAKTLLESFSIISATFPSSPFLGTRVINDNGSLGSYDWKSYSQVYTISSKISYALTTLNLRSGDLDIIGIFSRNREEWIIIEIACLFQDITTVTLSDTTSLENLIFIIRQCWISVICCSKPQFDLLMKNKENFPSVKIVIMFDKIRASVKQDAESLGVRVLDFAELLEFKLSPVSKTPQPNSIYTISYTSGTTGDPKGVMLTHHNIISALCGVELGDYLLNSKDSYLLYLPHSHIYDRIFFFMILNAGGRIGLSSGNINNIKEDLQTLRPTTFVSVPQLYNRFYEAIHHKFNSLTGFTKSILMKSLAKKMQRYEETGDFSNGVMQGMIFKKVINSLGGNIRMMVCGSASISGEVLKFLKVVLACPILEGYGLTESSGASLITYISDSSVESIGGPLPGLQVKLKSLPEFGYEFKEDRFVGELLIRGPSICVGYYKSSNESACDSEGWLHTGDIAERNPKNGSFKIIDRIKNIIKMSQGEYVSLDKVERALMKSKFVSQCLVYGDPIENFLIGVVVPSRDYVLNVWMVNNNSNQDWEGICTSGKLKRDILNDFADICSRLNFENYEFVQNIYVEPCAWSDLDILTATQKLMRHKAILKYKSIIQKLYSEI